LNRQLWNDDELPLPPLPLRASRSAYRQRHNDVFTASFSLVGGYQSERGESKSRWTQLWCNRGRLCEHRIELLSLHTPPPAACATPASQLVLRLNLGGTATAVRRDHRQIPGASHSFRSLHDGTCATTRRGGRDRRSGASPVVRESRGCHEWINRLDGGQHRPRRRCRSTTRRGDE
jgi:hypothetical protein